MEPNFKKFKFNLSEEGPKKNICNFFTCWSCHGKEPPNIKERDKLKKLISRKNQGNIIRMRLKNIAQMKNARTVKESSNTLICKKNIL